MVKKVMDYCQKYHMLEPDDTIVAGISGGADSVCLLFMLLEMKRQLPFTLKVVHVNHKIRKDAGKDADYVEKLCRENEIPFYLVEADVEKMSEGSGLSVEEQGRLVRYRAFEEALEGKEGKIAVAHNSNDRAETMLFHLFRGTGLLGAGGIRPVNDRIIRPLLCLTRREIEDWLKERDIAFCKDSTNEEDGYTRNKIRHHVLSYAQERICPKTVENMNRAADELLLAEKYLAQKTREAMERCVTEEKGQLVIALEKFRKEDEYIRGRLLHTCIGQVADSKKDITSAHIRSVEKLFASAGSKELHLPYQIVVYKKYDLGMIKRKRPEEGKEQEAAEDGREFLLSTEGEMMIPGLGRVEMTVFSGGISQNIPQKTYTKWLDYDKITSSAVFRTKRPGDYLMIATKEGIRHKRLQDFFVNEKIPKDERARIFMLAEGSHILWIPGFRISEYYKISRTTRNILQITVLERKE